MKAPGRSPPHQGTEEGAGTHDQRHLRHTIQCQGLVDTKAAGAGRRDDEYAAFVRRVIAAYSHRVAAGDIDAISDMTRTAAESDDAISQAVTGLRAAGHSWADIAARLGVTRQAAQQRWGRA